MRILVTGGAGFVGSHVVDALRARGDEVAVLDDLSTGRRAHVPADVELVEADLVTPAATAFVGAWRPDAVAHLAARASVRESVEDPVRDARTNVLGTVALLEACRRASVRRVVFASTGGAMFSTPSQLPTPEREPPAPESPYGCAKLAAEGYLDGFARAHALVTCSLRLANVYGPRQSPHGEAGVVAIFAARWLGGAAPTIHGDGRQTRDYVYVADVVEAFLLALDRGLAGTYHVGTGVETSTRTIADLVRGATGSRLDAVHGPERPGDVARSALDASAFARATGWRPRVALRDGLRSVVAALRP